MLTTSTWGTMGSNTTVPGGSPEVACRPLSLSSTTCSDFGWPTPFLSSVWSHLSRCFVSCFTSESGLAGRIPVVIHVRIRPEAAAVLQILAPSFPHETRQACFLNGDALTPSNHERELPDTDASAIRLPHPRNNASIPQE